MSKRLATTLAGVYDYYGKEMTEFTLDVWMRAMKGRDPEEVEKAITGHIQDPAAGQFLPKVADVIKRLDGTHADRSLIAWGKVLDAAQRVGAYQSVCFDESAIHAAITDMGGWAQLCRAKTEELPFVQRRFCDAYKAYAARGVVSFPAVLAGEHQITNAATGRRSAPPVLIGNPEKARQVLHSGGQAAQITSAADVVRSIAVGGA